MRYIYSLFSFIHDLLHVRRKSELFFLDWLKRITHDFVFGILHLVPLFYVSVERFTVFCDFIRAPYEVHVIFLSRLEKMGALDVSKVVHAHQGWRLITCIWLHAGVLHLLANMLSLLVIGIRLEQEFGFGMCSNLLVCFMG